MTSVFAPRRDADVADLIDACPLALLVSGEGEGFAVTPLPLLAVRDAGGRVVELIGHFARANPHVAKLEQKPRAQALFLGPNAAIPASWVSKPRWAPTWNYAFVRLDIEVRLDPEDNDAAVRQLVHAVDGDRWSVDSLGDRYAGLIGRIVAFRAKVLAVDAVFKLGQDEDRESFAEILAALGGHPLAALMQGQAE